VRSIKSNTRKTSLDTVPEYEMTSIIEKLVEIYSGSITVKNIENPLRKSTINFPVNKMLDISDEATIKRLTLENKNIVCEFAKAINADAQINTKFDERMVSDLEKYLMDMNVLSVTPVTTFRYSDEFGWRENETEHEYYIVQPAIKFFHLEEGKRFIETQEFYRNLSREEKDFMQQKLEEKIFGDMTEQIILFDTRDVLSKTDYEVTKPVFYKEHRRYGEYDMLIHDKNEGGYYGFEIKHTSEPGTYQEKHLTDSFIKEIVDSNFGERKNVSVLYRGSPFKSESGTLFLNITDFSLSVDKHKNIQLAINELSLNLPVVDLAKYEEAKEKAASDLPLEEKLKYYTVISQTENILKPSESKNTELIR